MEIYTNGTRVEFFDEDGITRRGRITGRVSTRGENGQETLHGYLIRANEQESISPYFAEPECIFPIDAVTDRPQMH